MIELRTLGAVDLRTSNWPRRPTRCCASRSGSRSWPISPRTLPGGSTDATPFSPSSGPTSTRNTRGPRCAGRSTFSARGSEPEVLESRGDEEVAVPESALRCDAVELEHALETGDPERALVPLSRTLPRRAPRRGRLDRVPGVAGSPAGGAASRRGHGGRPPGRAGRARRTDGAGGRLGAPLPRPAAGRRGRAPQAADPAGPSGRSPRRHPRVRRVREPDGPGARPGAVARDARARREHPGSQPRRVARSRWRSCPSPCAAIRGWPT